MMTRRTLARSLIVAVLLVALAHPAPAREQDSEVWGTRPGEVMVVVSANFGVESEEWLWHLPMESVEPHGAGVLRIQLRGGPLLYLPAKSGESVAATEELVRGAGGRLVRLEYQPVVDTPRGTIRASWTLSPRKGVVGVGDVPMTNALYSAMLRQLGDEPIPTTGVFAPLAAAQRRLELVERNVTIGNGREVDELTEDFLDSVRAAGLPLEFYRLADGSRASEEEIRRLQDRGHLLSAVDYWNSAISKFRQNRIVNPTLNDFEKEWSRVPEGTEARVDVPGLQGQRLLSGELLREFRRICGQKYLDAAASAARAEDPEWTLEMLRRFREELNSSGLTLAEFRVDGRPAEEGDFDGLVKRARREQGFLGFFRAIWHRILAEAMPGAPPV